MDGAFSYDRLQRLLDNIDDLERRVVAVEQRECVTVGRVRQDLLEKKVLTFSFRKVPSDYYGWTLAERARLLNCGTEHLCKTIVFKNTLCEHDECDNYYDSKYYCVVVQYCARINGEKLREFIHKLPPVEKRISKKKINFQLAEESVSLKLTGFVHNAVTPIGMNVKIPVIVCEACTKLKPAFIWLGGGAVDVKLCISVSELIDSTGALVANISEVRDSSDKANGDDDI